jgi:hypothetical protein
MPKFNPKRRALRTQPSRSALKARVGFIETMACLGVTALPEGPERSYEIKLDGSSYSPLVISFSL